MLFFRKSCFCEFLLESRRQGDSNKYTKCMIHKKKLFKSIRYSCFRRVHIKFFCNSKFILTAKSLVTNSVVITRVFCTKNAVFSLLKFGLFFGSLQDLQAQLFKMKLMMLYPNGRNAYRLVGETLACFASGHWVQILLEAFF